LEERELNTSYLRNISLLERKSTCLGKISSACISINIINFGNSKCMLSYLIFSKKNILFFNLSKFAKITEMIDFFFKTIGWFFILSIHFSPSHKFPIEIYLFRILKIGPKKVDFFLETIKL